MNVLFQVNFIRWIQLTSAIHLWTYAVWLNIAQVNYPYFLVRRTQKTFDKSANKNILSFHDTTLSNIKGFQMARNVLVIFTIGNKLLAFKTVHLYLCNILQCTLCICPVFFFTDSNFKTFLCKNSLNSNHRLQRKFNVAIFKKMYFYKWVFIIQHFWDAWIFRSSSLRKHFNSSAYYKTIVK